MTHRSSIGQNGERTRNTRYDNAVSHGSPTRRSQRDQDLGYMETTDLETGQGMNSRRLASYTPNQAISAARVGQAPYQSSARKGPPYIGSPNPPEVIQIDPRLSETGSQFSGNQESTSQDQKSNYTPNDYANLPRGANPYAGVNRSGSDDSYAQTPSMIRGAGYDLQTNQSTNELDGVMFSSQSNLAGAEPWNTYNQHRATANPSAFSPQRDTLGASNIPTAYTSGSPSSYNHPSSFHQSNFNYGPTPIAGALSPPRHNLMGLDGPNDLGPYHPFISTPSSSPYNGQGRPQTRATPTEYPYGDTSPLPGNGTSSRLGISPTTQTSGNTSDRLMGPTAFPVRRASTSTTTTSVSLASQASQSSASAPRYRGCPDPLPCPTCHKPFNGLDRITNLKRHKREAHERILYPCPVCDEEFSRMSNLRRHQRTRHQERER